LRKKCIRNVGHRGKGRATSKEPRMSPSFKKQKSGPGEGRDLKNAERKTSYWSEQGETLLGRREKKSALRVRKSDLKGISVLKRIAEFPSQYQKNRIAAKLGCGCGRNRQKREGVRVGAGKKMQVCRGVVESLNRKGLT